MCGYVWVSFGDIWVVLLSKEIVLVYIFLFCLHHIECCIKEGITFKMRMFHLNNITRLSMSYCKAKASCYTEKSRPIDNRSPRF